jgi:hypothetical protein
MTAINDYVRHMTKCNDQCSKHTTCLRYDKNADDSMMENENCLFYFKKEKDDSLEYLKNIFGMK